jgi:nucleolysin TIA-1/TIAR
MLSEIFSVAGPVQHVKIIPDRNYQHGGLNYGFVEYMDMRAAETALQTLNGRKIFDSEIRVNWAYQGSTAKEDTSGHFHVFVGDLSPEVNDAVLGKAFSAFGTLSDARVMWDMNSGKSRGYGFLAFRDKTDAEQAIATMNGEWLGSRAIRVNWANQKTQGAMPAPTRPTGAGGAPAPINFLGGPLSYETVVQQTPAFNSTVYVGNLVPYCTQADLIPLFQSIGYLSEIRMQSDRGFAFVKLDTHENAAMAIVQLQGQMVHGRPIKCSWGKDRADGGTVQPAAAISPNPSAAPYGVSSDLHFDFFWPFSLEYFRTCNPIHTACLRLTHTASTDSLATQASVVQVLQALLQVCQLQRPVLPPQVLLVLQQHLELMALPHKVLKVNGRATRASTTTTGVVSVHLSLLLLP